MQRTPRDARLTNVDLPDMTQTEDPLSERMGSTLVRSGWVELAIEDLRASSGNDSGRIR